MTQATRLLPNTTIALWQFTPYVTISPPRRERNANMPTGSWPWSFSFAPTPGMRGEE